MKPVLLFAAAAALSAQMTFEVASIKPAPEHSSMFVRPMPGGRLSAASPVRLMLMNAYGLQYSQIVGGPDWLNSEAFTVEAKAEGNPGRDQLMLMLQSLLEDRFHLRTHREQRDLPVYTLTVGKNGPKLASAKDAACDANANPPCGRMRISMSRSGVHMEGAAAPTSELIRVLAIALSRPVVDRTGLTGVYDIRLDFVDDGPGATPAPDSAGPSIFAALSEQLGLKLEAAKAPVEVLVIDHIEHPTAN